MDSTNSTLPSNQMIEYEERFLRNSHLIFNSQWSTHIPVGQSGVFSWAVEPQPEPREGMILPAEDFMYVHRIGPFEFVINKKPDLSEGHKIQCKITIIKE